MDLSDVQGLVLHPYRRLPWAAYLLFRFLDHPDAVKQWLGELLATQSIDSAVPKDVGPPGRPGVRLNVAFTYSGLSALGLDRDALQTFPLAFAEGLGRPWKDVSSPDHRSRILGDVGTSAPSEWSWGYQGSRLQGGGVGQQRGNAVDALLLVFAADRRALCAEVNRWIREAESRGASALGSTTTLYGGFPADLSSPVREPFGFVDGASQPLLKGAIGQLREKNKVTQPQIQELEDGEILLGSRDGHRQVSLSPKLALARDPLLQLPPSKEDPDFRDLGHNGTYLVFRQLAQDVELFQADCDAASKHLDIPVDRFKALLVGRWQDGSPLVKCPIAHDPALASPPAANDFDYSSDPHGDRCPIGAHVRRANPRDSLGENAEHSWLVSNRHRIMRRGRPYDDRGQKGLHFICLNADIERQFEFIQQNWINSPTFGGLDGEDDPIMGPREGDAASGCATLPPPAENRLRRRASGLSRFVTVKGGGYFFLPSLTTLGYLVGTGRVAAQYQAWQPAPAKLSKADWLQFFLLTRFSLLLAAALAAAPLTLLGGGAWIGAIARPMFVVSEWWEMLIISALASLAAAVALITFRLVQLYAKVRFEARTPGPAALTWPRMLLWQLTSWPVVGATVWVSAIDAAWPDTLWRELYRFGLVAAAGYPVALGVLFLAAAARNRSVRPENSEEPFLLPPSNLLERLRRKPSADVKIVGRVVRFIESRTVMWTRGKGYVDHETGRILPGHLAVAMLAVTVGIIYAAGWTWLRPPVGFRGVQLPPIAYLLFLLIAVGLVAPGVAFFLDRFRVPLLTALLVWIVVAALLPGTDHEFKVEDSRRFVSHPDAGAASMVARADEYHRIRGGTNSTDRPVVVVAGGGGGIHQAAWTARVLAGLTEVWGSAFSGNLRLISTVSASSVGALHFVNEFTASGPPRGDMSRVVHAAKQAATGDIWWGFSYPDLLRVILPFSMKRLVPGTFDRGWALEQAWHRALGLGAGTPAPTMADWQAETIGGWRPAVAFNAMIVESGERAVLATYDVPASEDASRLDAITSNRDLSVITAARLSASFPYVTPFARPSNSTNASTMLHLTDGGYWDNYGIVSALEWLRAAAPVLASRRVLVVRIPPLPGPQPRGADQPWVWQQIAPLAALESVRTNAQRVRNEREIQSLSRNWVGSLTFVEVPFGGGEESLGWHLTRRERCEIEAAWRDTIRDRSRAPMSTIASVLGPPPPPTTIPLPEECQ